MKKLVVFLLIVFMIPLFMVSCKKESNVLVINSYMSDPEPRKVFDGLVDMFKEQNPNMEIKVNTFAHEDFKTLIRTWLPSDSAPDVVTWFAGERLRFFADLDLLEPLNDVVDGGFESEFPKAFKSSCGVGETIYFIPQSWYWWGIYYNKKVFADNNIAIPKTWDEFVAVCEKLKNNGIVPIAIGTQYLWPTGGWFDSLNMRVNGVEFHTKLTAGDVSYTDPKVKKALSYLGELSSKGYFLPNHTSYNWQEAATRLYTGEAGMYYMGQFIKDVIEDQATKDNIDFFRFPIIDKTVGLYEDTPIDGFMMPAKAQNKESGKKFLKFIASKEAQEYFSKELGRLAANKNVAPPDDDAAKGLQMILDSDGVMQFYDRDADPEMADRGMNALVEYMNNPGKLDSILENLEKERQRIYKD